MRTISIDNPSSIADPSLSGNRPRRARPFGARLVAKLVLFTSALVVVAATTASGAFAAPAPAPAPAKVKAAPQITESWALTPTGTDPNEPGARPDFGYTLTPGAVVKDSLTVWNYGDVQLTFHVYATDAINTASDGFDLIPGDEKPKDVGSWIKISQSYLTLPASSRASLPFTLHVPANATPGDHSGGIVASSETAATDKSVVKLDRRAGSRVYLRVSGPVTPALVVEHLSSKYDAAINPLGGSLDVSYTVRNNGNVRLGAHQKVTISDIFGKVADRKPNDLPDLLPGNAVTITEHFTNVAATLHLSTKVTLDPFVPKESGQPVAAIHPTTANTGTWAIPWTILVVLLVLGIVIVYLRRRQARPRRTPSAPTPPVASGPNGHAAPKPIPADVPAGARR